MNRSETEEDIAAVAESAFQEGLRLRSSGESGKQAFQMSAANYERLRKRGVANPALYGNLSHAYVLAGELPNAILTLRRGLRLWPYDTGLQDNLAAARALAAHSADNPLARPPVEKRSTWLSPFALAGLLSAAFMLYGGLCVSLTRWWMTRRSWLLAVGIGCLLAASLPASLFAWLLLDADRRHRAEADRTLVVINDDGVLLRKGDSLLYPPRYDTPLNRGVEARLVHERGDWVQIELTGGEIGWVARKLVLIDQPDAVSPK